jgi:hypothetical protein
MKKIFLGVLLMAVVNIVSAQQDTLRKTIDEVVVTANKFGMLRRQVVQRIDIVTKRDLQWMNSMNAADLLSNTGNVLVQKSQGGGGSPIIRGFESNKVLLMVDGVRLNNAIFRGGHLQNVLRIDNAILEKVEILYGPSSAMYGSDALGGVMHFITKKPVLNDKFTGSTMLRYSTATQEKTGHVDVGFGGKRLASLFSLSLSLILAISCRAATEKALILPSVSDPSMWNASMARTALLPIRIRTSRWEPLTGNSISSINIFSSRIAEPLIHLIFNILQLVMLPDTTGSPRLTARACQKVQSGITAPKPASWPVIVSTGK